VAYHISLERSWRGLQLCFRSHLNWRYAKNVIGFQSCGSLNFKNFRTLRTKWHLNVSPMAKNIEYYKEEGGGFPQVQSMVSFASPCMLVASFLHQNCSNHALTNLLFSLCRFMWIIYSLVMHFSPDPKTLARPLPPKCYELRNVLQFFLLPLFPFLDSHLSLWTSVGVH